MAYPLSYQRATKHQRRAESAVNTQHHELYSLPHSAAAGVPGTAPGGEEEAAYSGED